MVSLIDRLKCKYSVGDTMQIVDIVKQWLKNEQSKDGLVWIEYAFVNKLLENVDK